mgnify:CR=1 FL=1
MTCTADGFSAWGKDIGGYSSNPEVAAEKRGHLSPRDRRHGRGRHHRGVRRLNDHGYDWWTNEGKLVLEDPELRSRLLHRGQLDRDAGQVQRRLSPIPGVTGPLGAERRF